MSRCYQSSSARIESAHGACGWFTATTHPRPDSHDTRFRRIERRALARAPSAELDRAVRLAPVKGICSCRSDVIRGAHERSRGGGHILLLIPFRNPLDFGHLGGMVHDPRLIPTIQTTYSRYLTRSTSRITFQPKPKPKTDYKLQNYHHHASRRQCVSRLLPGFADRRDVPCWLTCDVCV
jgi:hypothetical protein